MTTQFSINTDYTEFGEGSSGSEMDLLRAESYASSTEEPRRILRKGGHGITLRRNVPGGKGSIYRSDWFHSVINMPWRQIIFLYCVFYVSSWMIFSVLYLPLTHVESCANQSNLNDWNDVFMLSLMASSTIGYGYNFIGSHCPGYGITVLCVQVLVSLCIDCIFMGTIFVKLSRPQNRSMSIKFSPVAVVDNTVQPAPELQVRFADARRGQLCEPHVRMFLCEQVNGPDGFDIRVHTLDVDMAYIFLQLPFVARHSLIEGSVVKRCLEDPNSEFEIIVVVEGTEATTGLTTTARESYRKEEIYLNHRYLPMVSKTCLKQKTYMLDFSHLGAVAVNKHDKQYLTDL